MHSALRYLLLCCLNISLLFQCTVGNTVKTILIASLRLPVPEEARNIVTRRIHNTTAKRPRAKIAKCNTSKRLAETKHHCNESFTGIQNHKSPSHTNTKKKQCQCKVCDKCFPRPRNLKYHMGIHTGEKPYQCKVLTKKQKQDVWQ